MTEPVTPPTRTPSPDFPVTADRATGQYTGKAYNWAVHWGGTGGDEFEAMGVAAHTNAQAANESATAAATSSSTATTAASTAAAAANFKGNWSSLTGALAIPASAAYSGQLWMLLASVADVTAHTPGVSASWQEIGISASGAAVLTNKTLGAGTAFEDDALAEMHAIALCF